jgi:3-polyprenyl-4-hydroxybenzoate decarboxylase
MEDGYLGEAVGDAFLPVLQFQHRDVVDVFLPLETGFHNLLIAASKQRFPRQARKTALGLLGAGQMMFLKTVVAVDADHPVKDLDAFLDALNSKVEPSVDIIVLPGMVADQLAHAAPWENIHDKLLIDATTAAESDPLYGRTLPHGPGDEMLTEVAALPLVRQARMLRPSILVVTTEIEGGPQADSNMEDVDEIAAAAQRSMISQLIESIWQLEKSKNLRWLFITDDELEINSPGARRKLLWQLFCRFEVSRDLHFDENHARIAWDATAPIPSHEGEYPTRRWPATTIHDPIVEARIESMAVEEGWPWV